MRSISIRVRLAFVLLAVIFANVAVQVVSFGRQDAELAALNERIEELVAAQGFARALDVALQDQHNAVRDYVASLDPESLRAYGVARAKEAGFLTAISTSRIGNEVSGEIQAIRDESDGWRLRYLDAVIAEVQTGQLEAARSTERFLAGSASYHAVVVKADALISHLGRIDESTLDELQVIKADREMFFGIGIAVALFGALGFQILLALWVTGPLSRLLSIARRVDAGEDVAFPGEGQNEIGQLGDSLEHMRVGLFSQAGEASVVNRFTELTTFVEADGDVARATLDALSELVRPTDGSIHILNRSKDRAIPEGSVGDVTPVVVSLGQLSHCPGVKRSGLYVTKDLADQLSVRCPIYPVTAGTLACIPLLALGEVVGSVHLHWPAANSLPLSMRGSVSRITEHASLSVANRRLLVALQGMASTDARTGLPNSRTFDQALQDALADPGGSSAVAVLMLDIDHFKQFNDRNGHPAGDQALHAFADILKGAVREGDIPARYGGEEFAVILPNSGSEEATVVAERIRSRIESAVVDLGPGKTDRFTVSIGIAAAPADARDRVELLRIADAALYQAKTAGRNRVVVAGTTFSERHGHGEGDHHGSTHVEPPNDAAVAVQPTPRRARRSPPPRPISLKRAG